MTTDEYVEHDLVSANAIKTRRIVGGGAVAISVLLHLALVLAASRIPIESRQAGRPTIDRIRTQQALRISPDTDWARIEADILDTLRKATTIADVSLDETAQALTPEHDQARLAPATLPTPDLLSTDEPLEPPQLIPERETWQPRQDILAIESSLLESRPEPFERPIVPAFDRIPHAPDIALPRPPEAVAPQAEDAPRVQVPLPSTIAAIPAAPDVSPSIEGPPLAGVQPERDDAGDPFEEKPEDISPAVPIEDLLTARVTTYRRLRDLRYGYFRIEIDRIDPDHVTRIPKDIVFVQDSSASISELRLEFCRRALVRALDMLHPDDRFNIIDFSDRIIHCFDQWQSPNPASMEKGKAFINAMKADGHTDLYASMNALLQLERDPARHLIAVVITDGIPTTGVMDSSDIIGRFSVRNQGEIALYTFGVLPLSNYYLLDLLSYSNRGDVMITQGGRFGIENGIIELMEQLNRPVASGLNFYFSRRADIEVYPVQSAHLYADRPLVLYGRYHRDVQEVVFQAVGQAGDRPVDMIFNLSLDGDSVADGDADIRERWAGQKLYHLIAKHARTDDAELLEKIRATARAYRQDIPHQRRLF